MDVAGDYEFDWKRDVPETLWRMLVKVEGLMDRFGVTRAAVLAATERLGDHGQSYKFKVTVGSSRASSVTHVGYQPDGSTKDPSFALAAPRSQWEAFGAEQLGGRDHRVLTVLGAPRARARAEK